MIWALGFIVYILVAFLAGIIIGRAIHTMQDGDD